MEDKDLVMFDGPIPGASLTTELGSEPHERPPEIADPADAYEDLARRMTIPESFERIAVAAELGTPVELIARAMVFSGWANGKYNFDVQYLIYGPFFELLMKMLDSAGIEYIALAKRKEDQSLNNALKLLDEKRAKIKELMGETDEEEIEEEVEEIEDIPDTPKRGGLMGGEK
tara:strand:+ start:1647 stop:2165 length:519 start_codon:yes stop_codon:yes gene_type:complete